MRDRDVLLNLSCQKLGHFRSVTDSSEKGVKYYLSQIISDEFNSLNHITKEDVIDRVERLGGSILLKDQIDDHIVINRFKDYMAGKVPPYQGMDYLMSVSQGVLFQGRNIIVSADLFINRVTGVLYFAKVKNSKPTLSYRSRLGNRPEDNVELLMLNLLKDTIVDGLGLRYSKAVPALFFLRSKKDDKEYAGFEETPGDNVIYTEVFSDMAYERLSEGSKQVDIEDAEVIDSGMCWNCPFATICDSVPPLTEYSLGEEEDDEPKSKKAIKPTKAQQDVIDVDSGIVRVNAGAGTGKTTIIVQRMIRLLKEGLDPKDFLLITFTNKGADEMRQRLYASELDEELVDNIVIETFNSLGGNIIMNNYESFGYKEEPTLIQQTDKYKIIIELLRNRSYIEGLNYRNPFMSFRYAKGAVVRLAELFDIFKDNRVLFIQDVYDNQDKLNLLKAERESIKDGRPFLEDIFYLYLEYKNILQKNNYIDFQDQIMRIVDDIESGAKILKNVKFKHIVVDEYQDTNEDQLKIIKYLSEKDYCQSLMVVGDDSQSIFRFRGARPDLMLNFNYIFNGVVDYNVVENFRSTKEIVELANEVNRLNTKRYEKDLISCKDGELPELRLGNLFDFVDFTKIWNDGQSGETTAIIARTNYELVEIKKLLASMNIPSIIEAPLINNNNVKLFSQIMDYVIDGEYDIGIFNYLYLYNDEFRSLEKEDQKNYLEEYKKELKKELPIGYSVFNDNGEVVSNFDILERYLDGVVDDIQDIELKVFYDELKEELADFEKIKKLLNEMFLLQDRRTLQSFISFKGITLSTAHSSKGREFDNVYLILDKFNPSSKDEEDINEEVRLLFVAITRAKKNLYMYSSDDKSYFYPILEEMDDRIRVF